MLADRELFWVEASLPMFQILFLPLNKSLMYMLQKHCMWLIASTRKDSFFLRITETKSVWITLADFWQSTVLQIVSITQVVHKAFEVAAHTLHTFDDG